MIGPWFFNLLISICYTSLSVFLFVRTDFAFLIYYDLSTVVLMLLSIGLMLEFLRKMHLGQLDHLRSPLIIPHPTYICSLVLTASVTIGYCYIFVYKLALYPCDRAVEAQDWLHMALDCVLRLSIALYSLISFIYIMQRLHIGSIDTKFDIFTRNFINCVFGIIWLRFVLLKAYYTIEQFCRDQLEMMSIVKAFCPPYIKNGFHCHTSSLRMEQQIWYRVHYGLLKSVIVTCASELVPVLLVGHWLACGRAELAVRKMTMKMNAIHAIKNFSMKKLSTVTDAKRPFDSDKFLLFKWPSLRWLVRLLVLYLSIAGFLLWLLSFYNYIHDEEESAPVFVQDAMEVGTSLFQLAFFVLLFIWTRQIGNRNLDLRRRAESKGDQVIIFGSTLLLSVECVCEVMELLFFSFRHKHTHLIIKLLDIVYSISTIVANWLEALCLMKVVALNDKFLLQLRPILPCIAIGSTIFNFTDFAMTYFYIETEKHHLKGVIESLESSEFFVLVGVTGRLLDTANYLYTFTCALCWIDVLLRYYHVGYFSIGKGADDEEDEEGEPSRCPSMAIAQMDHGQMFQFQQKVVNLDNGLAEVYC